MDAPQETQEEGKLETKEQEEKVEKVESQAEAAPDTTGDITAIEKGQKILDGIDEGMKKYEALVKRQEEAAARMLLGGKGAAGQPQKTEKEVTQEKVDEEVKTALERFT